MKRPQTLEPGDRIGIVAPAKAITENEVQTAIELYKSWGLVPVPGKTVRDSENYMSDADNERLSDLQDMLNDSSIKAISMARGGYGSIRILDALDWTRFIASPKWIIGFSDITYIHAYLNHALNIESLHASMPVFFPGNTVEALDSMKDALFGVPSSLATKGNPNDRQGTAQGLLVGGNMAIVQSMIGTNTFPDTRGNILFLEDIDEYLYQVDRMTMHMKRAGLFDAITALVLGGMTDIKDNAAAFGRTLEEIILEKVNTSIPIAFDLPAGHIDDNKALILGRKYELVVEVNGAELKPWK